ncbi:MAG: hypothetical protein FWE82_03990 [Defluviitaleaceae bacterium]|nr:hypothetical protein [Defluviitaleaceae bacterium]
MTKTERIEAVIAGKLPDRPPVLGGWIAHPRALVEISGAAEADYLRDPRRVAVSAYEKLGADGLIGVFTTKDLDTYRNQNKENYLKSDTGKSFEEAVRIAEGLPDAEEYAKQFDFDACYNGLKKEFADMKKICGDMAYMPANWSAGARITWYGEYGYENFFLLVGLRPDLGAKLCRLGGVSGLFYSKLTARAVTDGLMPKAVLLGEDICTQRGPMISMSFMREHYAPELARGLIPLLEAGCKPVWHCDGDIRPMLPMLLDCGIKGFQGFQPECGMHIEEIVNLRARGGEKLLIMGPISVTTELPVMTPAEIRAKVKYYADVCKDKADLIFFTANTINPDVPVENIKAFYGAVNDYAY